ncbi:MAG: aminopeptidase [Segetibacter sp.]|nr:aminopeptidase [Segetibacter sp.]
MKRLLVVLAFVPVLTFAQSKKQKKALVLQQQKADQATITNLKGHIQFLADDKLEGRATGTRGEQIAAEYISTQFKNVGLAAKGTNGFLQEFTIEEGKLIDPSTRLMLNSNQLILQKDYIPLAFSAAKKVVGMPAMALRERGVPWFTDVKDWLESNKGNTGFNIDEAIKKEAEKVAAKGATALFIYNSSKLVDNINFVSKDKSPAVAIPVLYITGEGYNKYFKDHSELLDIEINVSFTEKLRIGRNVVGYLDNGAASTITIGAHYDHLGWGENGNALDSGKIIRNGADDNASGTAALIELARLLASSKSKKNNYLFIAFSGEEVGLLGSKYWLENRTVTTPINYMINLDMVGRYDPQKKLSIGGFGTSPAWSSIMTTLADKTLQVTFDSTGGGPSDHASFYRKDIPVLFFFTGIHQDYHKATDDYEKINYDGELKIVRFISRIIEATDNLGKLYFQKTREPLVAPARYSVSLGVIPDYSFKAGGLRIDGVSANKLASKLGLVGGDVLVQLGPYAIRDINSYMEALGRFKAGDKTSLKIKRGTEDKEFTVEF